MNSYFYEVAILSSPLNLLTYRSSINISIGKKVEVKLRGRSMFAVVIQEVSNIEFKCESMQITNGDYYSSQQIKTADFMSRYYFCSLGEALAPFVPYADRESVDVEALKTDIVLSEDQKRALVFLKTEPVSLLFGDTGCGKSEIYMKWFEEVLRSKKRALFLMPEISLTPQMQLRLEEKFGKHVVMWHSALSKKKRSIALEKITSGEAYIVAGARSALFLPIKNLGLIVVDEEHDDSYKSANKPRYNAKDMAIYYANVLDIPVLLGSATPSLTSYKKFPHFRLKNGYFRSTKEYIFERSLESITPAVEGEIKKCVESKNQAMLFIPTRANFKYLLCNSCSHRVSCQFCSVGMSIHRYSNHLRCHYCGFSQPIPASCSECGGELRSMRLGTAEAVSHFRENFKQIKVAQFDRDSVTTQKKLVALLESFNEHQIDMLIGTQMLSKGHDYHGVKLAVVLGLDNLLSQSDYRARERAVSLLLQIAGRSGRKSSSRVFVQSFNEDLFRAYLDDYEKFLIDELKFREGMYPPYKRLCRVLFAHKSEQKASEAAQWMRSQINELDGGVEVVGCGAAVIEKIAGKYRYQLLLRADKSTQIIKVLGRLKHPLAQIDMDPVEFS